MILLGDFNYGISNTERDNIVYHGLTVIFQISRQEMASYKEFEYIIELLYHPIRGALYNRR